MSEHLVPLDRRSWVDYEADCEFPIQNLPYGIFSTARTPEPRVGVPIGDRLLDLSVLFDAGFLPGPDVFHRSSLNSLMSRGRPYWTELRGRIAELLDASCPRLRDDDILASAAFVPLAEARLHLPVEIGAFVDFYSSEQHASNVGRMFRDPNNPLLPNWKHLPVGYNGRASSVVVSGTPIRRPNGQTVKAAEGPPSFGPSRQLDFELEMGFYTGRANPLGEPLAIADAGDFVFGFSLVNDWSARDVQRWEYAPLGPFLAKTFATTVSPWVVPVDALSYFRTAGPTQDPLPLPYLRTPTPWHFDLHLGVDLEVSGARYPTSRTNSRHLYWSCAQQLAHQGVNGTNVQVGDLYASGTISGDAPDSYGSLLELAWRGERPVSVGDSGETRVFLIDGDEVVMTGYGQGDGFRIGFGECRGRVTPAPGIER
ncbi:MAG: fumarylacetoacetase [Fimbriimonadaceae bacterium]|nr:fumarylacetoacetase [Fimbriimonadaceae bacterium]